LPTTEALGILPIPLDIRATSGMAEFNPNLDQKHCHHYLAGMQGTRKAILPVHTPAEHDLFHTLMKSDPAFTSRSAGPNWKLCIKVWNKHADSRKDIYYKLVEQLKTYYLEWMTNLNVKQSLSLSSGLRHPVNLAIRDPARSTLAPPVPVRPLTSPAVTKGFNLPEPRVDAAQLPQDESTPPSMSYSASDIAPPPQTPGFPSQSAITAQVVQNPRNVGLAKSVARKRVAAEMERSRPQKKQRQARTCRKCKQPQCPGRQSVRNCRNPCQDCRKVNCRGRNPHKPDKKCDVAWD
ncbi:hypothetical protein BDZ97DRAFT_1995354, partial [Flammula alnicola]